MMSRGTERERNSHTWQSQVGFYRVTAVLTSAFALAFFASCDTSRTEPSPTTTTTTTAAPPTTTTTTVATTTTTAGPGPTTTTTSTTTTAANVDYANQVHPIWAKETCTDCHTGGNPLDLTGSATQTCASINARDSANQNLIILGDKRAESQIIEKLNGKVSHVGGSFSCWDSDKACYQTILAWLAQGAKGPSGANCGG
jgi:hypothetical protein